MAKKILMIDVSGCEADVVTVWGKVFNVFDSYANAIANADTGLVPVFAVNRLTGEIAAQATTQHGKNSTSAQAGITADEFGKLVLAIDTETNPVVYINSGCGRQGGPLKIVADMVATEESSS